MILDKCYRAYWSGELLELQTKVYYFVGPLLLLLRHQADRNEACACARIGTR